MEMVLKRIHCAEKESVWEASAFFTGKGCGSECSSSGSRKSFLQSRAYLNLLFGALTRVSEYFLLKEEQFSKSRVLPYGEQRRSFLHPFRTIFYLKALQKETNIPHCLPHSHCHSKGSEYSTSSQQKELANQHPPHCPKVHPKIICLKQRHTPCSILCVLSAGSINQQEVRTAGVNISVLHVLVVGKDFHKTPRLHSWVYT